MTPKTTNLLMVLPVYNEEQSLVGGVDLLVGALKSWGINFEIVLVENGSNDASPVLVDELAARHSHVQAVHLLKPNYGEAVRCGFLRGRGDCMANFSVDLMDLEFLKHALTKLDQWDMVVGSKYLSNSGDQRSFWRRFGGIALSRFTRFLFGIPISDTHGLMAMQRNRMIPWVEKCRFGYEVFDTELVVRAYRAGLTVYEIPLQVQEKRPTRTSPMRRACRILIQLLLLRVSLWIERLSALRQKVDAEEVH